MEVTDQEVKEYIAALKERGVTPQRLGLLIAVLDPYADKMLAEAAANIADQEGASAVSAAEAARQKAQSEANAANLKYLQTVKALAGSQG